uniref:class I SAM-dependent methyltransferase n=1 Tax=Herbidospora sakaeratensis TaxID=564415 RepID=UPI00078157EE|nr:class I SAM-dependent methyltransferase [Herbidospora sakaeratensis]
MTLHVDQYDQVAESYQQADLAAFRTLVEAHSLLDTLGPADGLRVLDVACGEGFYTRRFADLGAGQVVGVDSSAEMVRLGRSAEEEQPRGIVYHVHDAARMPVLGEFDVVAATYLLHYAVDLDHMRAMCDAMAANLRPGGRLLTLIPNPAMDPSGPSPGKYGFSLDWPLHPVDGDPATLNVAVGGSTVSVSLRYWSERTYREVIADAGYTDVRWHPLRVSPDAPRAFFDDYLANPHAVLVEAVAPGGGLY